MIKVGWCFLPVCLRLRVVMVPVGLVVHIVYTAGKLTKLLLLRIKVKGLPSVNFPSRTNELR